MPQDHWLPGFNFNVGEWFEGDHYETLAICRWLALARAAFCVGRRESTELLVTDSGSARRLKCVPTLWASSL